MTTTTSALIALGLYLLALLAMAMQAKHAGFNAEGYFLAGRNLGPIVLFFTLIATNFSAFFFIGFAGAGYRIGLSYYPMMAFGTGLAALSFASFGLKVRELGRRHGFITPSELIGYLVPGQATRLLVLAVMVLFTMPYLALQPVGAGYLLETLTDGLIPYPVGALLLTIAIVLYVVRGGMDGVARTDVLQGVLMFVLMLAGFIAIAQGLGGFELANRMILAQRPALFSPSGLNGFFTPQMWMSYLLLWPLCLPMFPQMLMRFFAAGEARSLRLATILYPVVAGTLFLCPVLIGVWGHLAFPDLIGRSTDGIMPLMLERFSPAWLNGLVMVGAIAAFMSTLDSQLLALSSMLTRDVYRGLLRPQASISNQVLIGRFVVVVLALGGLAIALNPPQAILALATQAFSGLALLAPVMFAAVFGISIRSQAAVLSILLGELTLLGFTIDLIPEKFTAGYLPLLPALSISLSILMIDQVMAQLKKRY